MIDTIIINSLWQGAFVVAIAAVVSLLHPQRHAATRYAIWFTALLALAVLPLASLWHPAQALAVPMPVIDTAIAASTVTARAADVSGMWLVISWLAGATFFIARLLMSHLSISRIVRDATPATDTGLAGVVISNDVTIPIAAGLVSPVVVIPAALVYTLEPSDLECLVQHERAHIRRMDIAGNLIQRVIEACLFFNPWVYIIGRQLVSEREAACDDWAVHATGEPDRYASCLAEIARDARGSHVPLLTPSAIWPRHMLVGRIARILDGEKAQLKINYFAPVASAVAFGALAMLLQTSNGLATVGTAVVAAASELPASCSARAQVINPAMPDIPNDAHRPAGPVSVNVLVTVAADGRPVFAKVISSSGTAGVDAAAVKAAMNSTYTPAMSNCKRQAGQYVFRVRTNLG